MKDAGKERICDKKGNKDDCSESQSHYEEEARVDPEKGPDK